MVYTFPPEGPRFAHGPFPSYKPAVRGSTWYPYQSEFDVDQDEGWIENLAYNGECVVHIPQLQDMDERPENLTDCWVIFGVFERLPKETDLSSDFGSGIQNRDPQLGIRLPDFTYSWQTRTSCEVHQGDLFYIRGIFYRVRNAPQDEQYYAKCDLQRMDSFDTGDLQSLMAAVQTASLPEHVPL